jgi:hypothetical protein
VSKDQTGPDHAPSDQEGLVMLREAAASGNLEEFEQVLGGLMQAERMGFWGKFNALLQLKFSMCSNLGNIVRLCNEIINNPNSSPSEVAWATAKRAKAMTAQWNEGCVNRNVS